jgi:hypothetical protein
MRVQRPPMPDKNAQIIMINDVIVEIRQRMADPTYPYCDKGAYYMQWDEYGRAAFPRGIDRYNAIRIRAWSSRPIREISEGVGGSEDVRNTFAIGLGGHGYRIQPVSKRYVREHVRNGHRWCDPPAPNADLSQWTRIGKGDDEILGWGILVCPGAHPLYMAHRQKDREQYRSHGLTLVKKIITIPGLPEAIRRDYLRGLPAPEEGTTAE